MKLFLSYAHIDTNRVERLVDLITTAGHDPWFDHALLPGQRWQNELYNAIAAADVFVYVLSQASLDSEWCQWEFATAVELQKPILPVLIESKLILPDSLSAYQYADFTHDNESESLAKLLGGLMAASVQIPQSAVSTKPSDPQGEPALIKQKIAPKQNLMYRYGIVGIASVLILAIAIWIVIQREGSCVSGQAPQTFMSTGDEHFYESEYNLALADYQCALEQGLTTNNVYIRMGAALIELERFDEAIEQLETAQEQNGMDANLAFNLGVANERNDNYVDALTYFQQAHELGFEPVYRVETSIGLNQRRLGQIEDAIDRLETVTEASPSYFLGWVTLGDAYFCANRMEDAFDAYSTYVTLIRDEGQDAQEYVEEILIDRPDSLSEVGDRYFECIPE